MFGDNRVLRGVVGGGPRQPAQVLPRPRVYRRQDRRAADRDGRRQPRCRDPQEAGLQAGGQDPDRGGRALCHGHALGRGHRGLRRRTAYHLLRGPARPDLQQQGGRGRHGEGPGALPEHGLLLRLYQPGVEAAGGRGEDRGRRGGRLRGRPLPPRAPRVLRQHQHPRQGAAARVPAS
jgi:hypothetical protein